MKIGVRQSPEQEEIPCKSCDFATKIKNKNKEDDEETADYHCMLPPESCIKGKVLRI